MKQIFRKSYWLIPAILLLVVALSACVRPAPGSQQPEDVTETPAAIPTVALPSPEPSTPTPPPDLQPTAPSTDGNTPTEPTPEGQTDPNAGGDGVATEPTAVPAGLPTTHVVVAGDTLYSISQNYGVPQEEIAAANNITTSSLLTVGQSLVIPVPGATLPDQSGGGQPGQPPSTGEQVHVVQPGENLFRISLRYGKSVNEVAAYNGIANPHYIYPGQVIRIP